VKIKFLIIVCLFLQVFLICACRIESFEALKRARKDDPEAARQIATALKDDQGGLELALRDFDIYGGQTRGWSSWMLARSSLDQLVTARLNSLSHDGSQPFSKRFEALWILWRRSSFADPVICDEAVSQACLRGENATTMARRRLASLLDDSALEIRRALAEPAANPISIDAKTFYASLRKVDPEE
jgi:hypothetical protein